MKNVIQKLDVDLIEKFSEKSVDFHCHGIGRFDFTEIPELSLQEIENILSQKKHRAILTLYLPKPSFDSFLNLMEVFHEGKLKGQFRHIAGFGLEGPLLASHGGTPESGVWMPTLSHWKALAECGSKGLIYTIFSPDAFLTGSNFASSNSSLSVSSIAEILLEGGVLPAPGHFVKTDPKESARLLQSVFDAVASWGYGATITDHLFNDMPHNFKHAWRTPEEKTKRDEEIKMLNIDNWNLPNLEEVWGPVPACMVKNAHKGLVKICQNFDGEHVDLAVVQKAVEIIGAENMLMMTDSIESKRLAGRNLTLKEGSTLLYQDEGIVAAGSQNVYTQIKNMASIGLNPSQIDLITYEVPLKIFQEKDRYIRRNTHAEADRL